MEKITSLLMTPERSCYYTYKCTCMYPKCWYTPSVRAEISRKRRYSTLVVREGDIQFNVIVFSLELVLRCAGELQVMLVRTGMLSDYILQTSQLYHMLPSLSEMYNFKP